ncbi:MAG: hypothetical protein IIC86_03955, partial [Chloroflexi bacterium]|nr:hypothetical protein [Chloroflexota bacterium]
CVVGGDGDDDLQGGGGDGNDVILGGPDNDKIHGGDGNDHLYGGDGDDEIKGGDGDDVIDGGPGDDEIKGGDGDDVIDGGPGSDECNGGAGANTITNCEPPPGPTGLTALFHHSLPTVDLTWQLVADAAYYNVYQGIASGGPYEGIGSSRSPSFADTAIAEDATYYYVVTTVDADGFESGSSNEAQVVTLLAAPMPPAGPEATSTPTPWPTATPNPTPTPTPEPAPTPEPTPTPAS